VVLERESILQSSTEVIMEDGECHPNFKRIKVQAGVLFIKKNKRKLILNSKCD
jgi:hypothetical protein